ncbi:MAG TPA: hypothetical protein VH619_20070 [Verrucomicrobiae bacterium]|jgi:hypothetical protein|nr:hypothetical protein [Verrucomicrobiae bacterium]
MNPDTCCQKTRVGAYVVAILGTFLLVGALVWLLRSYTETPSPFAARSAERMQIMQEFQAANGPLVSKYDWQDQPKGFVRVPIERAKELILEEWRDPAAGRSKLISRAAKEFAPPPKVPEKKNEYE